jgi:hypothetical protein
MAKQASNLISELVRQQGLLGLNDQAFARELGISRQLWAMCRDGEAEIGLSLLAGVMRKFPGLKDEVLAEVKAYRQDRHQTAQPAPVA